MTSCLPMRRPRASASPYVQHHNDDASSSSKPVARERLNRKAATTHSKQPKARAPGYERIDSCRQSDETDSECVIVTTPTTVRMPLTSAAVSMSTHGSQAHSGRRTDDAAGAGAQRSSLSPDVSGKTSSETSRNVWHELPPLTEACRSGRVTVDRSSARNNMAFMSHDLDIVPSDGASSSALRRGGNVLTPRDVNILSSRDEHSSQLISPPHHSSSQGSSILRRRDLDGSRQGHSAQRMCSMEYGFTCCLCASSVTPRASGPCKHNNGSRGGSVTLQGQTQGQSSTARQPHYTVARRRKLISL